jgi:DNA repair exonuclease SbcCD ATPase subunit
VKIIKLEISNTRKVEAFELTLDGKNLQISGETGTGKTTAVNALWEIITKHPDSITHGKKKGFVKVKLSDGKKTIVAERTNTKNSTVKIYDSNGDTITMADFKSMISALSVNPYKIATMSNPDKVRLLLSIAEIPVDLDDIDKDIAALEENRLDAHRKMELSKPGPEPEQVQRVSVSELVEERQKKSDINAENDKRKATLVEVEEESARLDSNIKELEERLQALKKDRENNKARLEKGRSVVAGLQYHDLDVIDKQIADIETTNEKAISYEDWVKKDADFNLYKGQHESCDADIKAKREEKKAALDEAKWPLEGLTIEDGKVYFKGCLLDNLGESEQMLVCAALAINDIKAHPLHVVRMDGVESMSANDFEALVKLFNGADIQVLSTRVSRGDVEPDEIEIVDGKYVEEKK